MMTCVLLVEANAWPHRIGKLFIAGFIVAGGSRSRDGQVGWGNAQPGLHADPARKSRREAVQQMQG
jgi:hypothetical protein